MTGFASHTSGHFVIPIFLCKNRELRSGKNTQPMRKIIQNQGNCIQYCCTCTVYVRVCKAWSKILDKAKSRLRFLFQKFWNLLTATNYLNYFFRIFDLIIIHDMKMTLYCLYLVCRVWPYCIQFA